VVDGAEKLGVDSRETAFEKTCATTQKNVKSRVFFWILKKTLKTYAQFQRPLNHSPSSIRNYGKSVSVSHQHQTSCYVTM